MTHQHYAAALTASDITTIGAVCTLLDRVDPPEPWEDSHVKGIGMLYYQRAALSYASGNATTPVLIDNIDALDRLADKARGCGSIVATLDSVVWRLRREYAAACHYGVCAEVRSNIPFWPAGSEEPDFGALPTAESAHE